MKRLLVKESGGCCAVCGYDRSVVNLQFHHVDPARKRFAMSMATGKALATYREEAAKCVLVCANCHGEIEAGLIPSPPPQARWGEEWTAVESAPMVEPEVIPDQVQLPLTDSDQAGSDRGVPALDHTVVVLPAEPAEGGGAEAEVAAVGGGQDEPAGGQDAEQVAVGEDGDGGG
jgi:hypothetical protein